MTNNIKKEPIDNKKIIYMCLADNTVGLNNYKCKLIFNLYNNFINKKNNNLNRINCEYKDIVLKYSSINTNLLKKNSVKFNNIRLNIIKNNENKNFNKKNM